MALGALLTGKKYGRQCFQKFAGTLWHPAYSHQIPRHRCYVALSKGRGQGGDRRLPWWPARTSNQMAMDTRIVEANVLSLPARITTQP